MTSPLIATPTNSWTLWDDPTKHVDAGMSGFDPYWLAGVQSTLTVVEHFQEIFQFDTNIGADKVIDSATITRNIDVPVGGASSYLKYYLGTWAATPPAADTPTFTGGSLAGSEALAEGSTPGVSVITLDPSAINKTGITSLRVDSTDGGSGLNDDFILYNGLILTIVYHQAAIVGFHPQLMFGR